MWFNRFNCTRFFVSTGTEHRGSLGTAEGMGCWVGRRGRNWGSGALLRSPISPFILINIVIFVTIINRLYIHFAHSRRCSNEENRCHHRYHSNQSILRPAGTHPGRDWHPRAFAWGISPGSQCTSRYHAWRSALYRRGRYPDLNTHHRRNPFFSQQESRWGCYSCSCAGVCSNGNACPQSSIPTSTDKPIPQPGRPAATGTTAAILFTTH